MPADTIPPLLRFQEAYFERIWGGNRLRTTLNKETPRERTIGEAWLISDHPEHESIVAEGPCAGMTLRRLIENDSRAVLGSRAELTPHGRFPLLLKLLDSAQALSVQVHPDDAAAKRLGEPDVGKTEMWHVFESETGSELICGLDPGVQPDAFAAMVADGSVEKAMIRFDAPAGTTAFVSAGTVHAIGGGILLAEIQQNSDITYRLYDWNRVDDQGNPRQLHIEKGLEVTHFGSTHGGPAQPLAFDREGVPVQILGACRYFAAELIQPDTPFTRRLDGGSFHILLTKTGQAEITSAETRVTLSRGEALLITGLAENLHIDATGEILDFHVPDLKEDVVAPLLKAGHCSDDIIRLGGETETSDLAQYV